MTGEIYHGTRDKYLIGPNGTKIHYSDAIISAMVSQIISLTIVYSTVYSGTDKRKHQSSASHAFVMGIHRWPVDSPHKGPVTWKMFPFVVVIMSIWLRGTGTKREWLIIHNIVTKFY